MTPPSPPTRDKRGAPAVRNPALVSWQCIGHTPSGLAECERRDRHRPRRWTQPCQLAADVRRSPRVQHRPKDRAPVFRDSPTGTLRRVGAHGTLSTAVAVYGRMPVRGLVVERPAAAVGGTAVTGAPGGAVAADGGPVRALLRSVVCMTGRGIRPIRGAPAICSR